MRLVAAVVMSVGLAVLGLPSPADAYPPGPTTTDGDSGVPGPPTTVGSTSPTTTIDGDSGVPGTPPTTIPPTTIDAGAGVTPTAPPAAPGSDLPTTGSSGIGTTGTVGLVLALAGLALFVVARTRRREATA